MNIKLLTLSLLALQGIAFSEVSVAVRVGPPPPRHVSVGVAPHPGYIHQQGYWAWNGRRHVWIPGRWVRPPHRRSAWVDDRWVRTRRGWVLVPGRWR